MTAPRPTALASTQLLLNLLNPTQTPDPWESERLRLNADWDDLAVRAIVLGLAPQVYQRFIAWGVKPPPRTAAKLAVTYQASAKRAADIYRQLAEALIAFNQHALAPVALKGVHLAAFVYADPALRPMNDIDLLFPTGQLPQAESILESLGYVGKYKSAELGAGVTKHTATFQRETPAGSGQAASAATPNPYLSTEADRMIEPHGSLEESWFGLKVDITPGVREQAITVELAGQPCHVLSTEDLVLHLCVHFCFHLIMGAPSMVQLADLLAVTSEPTQRSAPAINWTAFVARAQFTRSSPYVLAALTLAHKLLGAPIPPDVLTQLSQATPSPLRQRISNLSLADVLKRTQQKPITTLPERIRRGLADRAETARWAADWRGRWQVWRSAFNIFATDTGQMLLGKNPKTQISGTAREQHAKSQ
jgi:hypothetical protein